MEYSYVIASILFVAILGGTLYYLDKLARENNTNIGLVVRTLMNKNIVTIFFVIALVINLAEAAMCASVHPKGDQLVPNPIVRMVTHMIIAFASLVSMYLAMQSLQRISIAVRETAKSKDYGYMVKVIIGQLIVFIFCAFIGILGPIGNLFVLGNAAHEVIQVIVLFKWIFGTDTSYLMSLYTYKLPTDYMPFQEVSSVVFTALLSATIHIAFIVIEGVSALTDPNHIVEQILDLNGAGSGNSNTNDPGNSNNNSNGAEHEVVKAHLKEVLEFYGTSARNIPGVIDEAIQSLDEITGSNKDQMVILIIDNLNKIKNKISPNLDADGRIALEAEILKLFTNPTSAGGFDVQITKN